MFSIATLVSKVVNFANDKGGFKKEEEECITNHGSALESFCV